MANVLQIPVPSGNAAIVWPARSDPTINTILLINQDLNNVIYIGQLSSITANGQNTIPIPPNGSISVDPASTWYVVGATTGISPLVMVPNGQASFLSLTQALGELAIPSIRSPDYVPNVSGWAVFKDGSAEFNNLTIRGTFFGNDFIISNAGEFFYTGTPAAGNLDVALTPGAFSATDAFGNTTPGPGVWNYYSSGGTQYCFGLSGGGIGAYSAATQAGPWTPYEGITWDAGTITVSGTGGLTMGNGPLVVSGNSSITLTGRTTPASSAGNAVVFANANGEQIVIDGLDLTTYATQRRSLAFNSTQTSSTAFTTVTGLSSPVSANRGYRFRAQICWVADQSAGQVAFRFNGPATTAPTQASFETGSVTSIWMPAPVGLAATSNPGLTMIGGQAYVTKIDGVITTTASGTFSIQIANVTAGDTFHIVAGTYLDLMPL